MTTEQREAIEAVVRKLAKGVAGGDRQWAGQVATVLDALAVDPADTDWVHDAVDVLATAYEAGRRDGLRAGFGG